MLSQASTLHLHFMKWSFLVKKNSSALFFNFVFLGRGGQELSENRSWEVGGTSHQSRIRDLQKQDGSGERLTAKPLLAASA